MDDQAQKLRAKMKQRDFDAETVEVPLKTRRIIKANTFSYGGKHSTRFIAVTSGKGGVGKTNLVVNLALVLQKLGKSVLVIDADLGMANVNVVLGSAARYTLLDLLKPEVSLLDVMIESPHGIKFLSGGSGIEELVNLSYNEFNTITQKLCLCDDVVDIVLIDTGAGMGRNVLNFLWAADEVIVVTTPEPTSITDAYALMKAYYSKGNAGVQLVVNRMVSDNEGRVVCNKLEGAVEHFIGRQIKLLGKLYEDSSVVKAVKSQIPFVIAYPDCVASRCVYNVAYALTDQSKRLQIGGFGTFVNRLMNLLR